MTGDGPGSNDPVRRRPHVLPCPGASRRRTRRRGTLTTLGVGVGDPATAGAAADRLTDADVVFVVGEAEATVLFYAEAWRVELVDGDIAGVAAWFRRHPGGTAVLVTPGDPACDATLAEVAAGLGNVRVEHLAGLTLVPPRRRPLGWVVE
jgi:hypothetical protein